MKTDRVHELFEAELVGWSATKILCFDNVRSKTVPMSKESWVNFVIHWMPSDNIALGTKTSRNGIATMQIFTPFNSGPRTTAKIADYYFERIENKTIGDTIFTYSGELVRIGKSSDWHQSTANVTFNAI